MIIIFFLDDLMIFYGPLLSCCTLVKVRLNTLGYVFAIDKGKMSSTA